MSMGERITADQLEIVVHHIGGIGDVGPAGALGALGHVHWVAYDAVENALETLTQPVGGRVTLMNRCLGAAESDQPVHVTAVSTASSLLKPAENARDYTLMYANGSALRWGRHTQIAEVTEVHVHALDSLVDAREVPAIDFLSVDAQGAELSILHGASRSLEDGCVGVLCEVEFSPLYEGQALFNDIHQRLRTLGYRFCELYNGTRMNTALFCQELQGRGFLTFGEALFLRLPERLHGAGAPTRHLVKLLKLAAVSVAFDQLDYALVVCRGLQQRGLVDFDALADQTGVTYIALLRDLVREAERIDARVGCPGHQPGSAASRTGNAIKLRRYLLRAAARKASGRGSSKHFVIQQSTISEILHRYGLTDVAVKHALRRDQLPHLYDRVWERLAR